MLEAWNALGYCLLKKNSFSAAKDCFITAASLQENKESYRNLSRVQRLIENTKERLKKLKMANPSVTKLELDETIRKSLQQHTVNLKESIILAKKALEFDMKDGDSWCL